MRSRWLTADRIHDGRQFLPDGYAIEVREDGTILNVGTKPSSGDVARIEGILCPGFVNAHCHLELSHMSGMIPEGTGLIPFLQAVTRQRAGFTDEQKKAARLEASGELTRNGVVAVGDIANTSDTIDIRASSGLHMHTFIECIGFTETGAAARLAYAADVMADFRAQAADDVTLRQSIVPHAPYSVSPGLFRMISDAEEGSLISIHNQESPAEDQYYRDKSGPVRDLLEGFGIDDAFFSPSGTSSLQTCLPLLDERHPLILVHNTCSSPEDIAFAERRAIRPWWCLCPGANLYIEGRMPDVPGMLQGTDRICIGTDSLASNRQLSVFAELQLLKAAFPSLSWEDLLRWGTGNGAAALQMEDTLGSFTPGTRPGVLGISSLDDAGRVHRFL